MVQRKKASSHSSRQTRWLAALGIVFVLGSFTMLLREALVAGPPVAEISVRVDEVVPSTSGYLVRLEIENAGSATAAALGIEAVVRRGGANIETSSVTVDYVAAGSTRNAALFFSNDPRQGELTVRAKGYIEP